MQQPIQSHFLKQFRKWETKNSSTICSFQHTNDECCDFIPFRLTSIDLCEIETNRRMKMMSLRLAVKEEENELRKISLRVDSTTRTQLNKSNKKAFGYFSATVVGRTSVAGCANEAAGASYSLRCSTVFYDPFALFTFLSLPLSLTHALCTSGFECVTHSHVRTAPYAAEFQYAAVRHTPAVSVVNSTFQRCSLAFCTMFVLILILFGIGYACAVFVCV